MPIADYNLNPDLNTVISGISIAEGCPPGNVNNAIRQLMADVKRDFEAGGSDTGVSVPAPTGVPEAPVNGKAYVRKDGSWAAMEASAASRDGAPAGTIVAMYVASVKNGSPVDLRTGETRLDYVLCDGSTYLRDGKQFNTPDLRGRFIIGVSGAFKAYSTGGKSEATFIPKVDALTLTRDQIPAHGHTYPAQWSSTKTDSGSVQVRVTDEAAQSAITTAAVGGTKPHKHVTHEVAVATLPPYCALYYFMKV